jgi:S-adenosylmethionine synthetase
MNKKPVSHPVLPAVAELVLPGHPDRLCDAVADGVVDFVRQSDARGQCGVEVACVFDRVVLTGRVASHDVAALQALRAGHWRELARAAYASAGYGEDAAGHRWGPAPEDLQVEGLLHVGPFDDGERELRHLSDDQAICVGYACRSPATDWLPPAHWLARRIGRELVRLRAQEGAGQLGPDGKVLVYGAGKLAAFRPTLVSLSLNHHARSDWLLLRRIAEEAVETACAGLPTPGIELNGAGMFVCGGPNGDNGLSGKKLVVDAYGPGVPIGGGAWSGKDLCKVDRLGGLAARQVALASLLGSDADAALVTLSYLPGGDRPARVDLLLDGAPSDAVVVPAAFGALETARLHALFVRADVTLVELARWGHQRPGLPWELPQQTPAKERAAA